MKPILTSAEMAAADRHTIETLGEPGLDLMERAARACVETLLAALEPQDRVAVVAGAGNNGGDGFAVARMLAAAGRKVAVFTAMPVKKLRGDALANFERLQKTKVAIAPIGDGWTPPADAAWIVDALFGTGLDRPVEGRLAAVIGAINDHPAKKLAVDMPSGLSGATGARLGVHVKADVTVTFQHLKLAHAVSPACVDCGQVIVADIGIQLPPSAALNRFMLEPDDYARPPRDLDSHKGSYGALAIVGGFAGMEGAANICAMAALRFGVGKARVYTDRPGGRFRCDSVMVDRVDRFTDPGAYSAIAIGPGLSRTEAAMDCVAALDLRDSRVLWDADGLVFIKRRAPAYLGREWVMTPHPGEAAMLLDSSSAAVQRDRLTAAEALGERYPGGWIVLKGYRTLIRSPRGELFVCGAGGPALAVAGSGDALSGMIAALMAQGRSTEDAALLGCLRHGMAGDEWSRRCRDYSMTAEDIVDNLKH